MDNLEQIAIAYALVERLKKVNQRKNAYKCVLQLVKDSGFPDDPESKSVDELIADALKSKELQQASDEEYAFLAKWLPPIPEPDLQTVLQRFFADWKPDKETLN